MSEFIDSKGVTRTIKISMQARARVEWIATQARLALAGFGAKEEDYAVTFNDVITKANKGHFAEILYLVQALTDEGNCSPEEIDSIIKTDRTKWMDAFVEAAKEEANPSESQEAPSQSSKNGASQDTNQAISGKPKSGK